MQNVIIYGATGYTGRLTVAELVKQGVKPVLAGRNAQKLQALAELYDGLEWQQIAEGDVRGLQALLSEKDVLLSLVGPFARYGDVALQAAVAAKSHYIDSTGEPAFIRKVFQRFNGPAKNNQTTFLTAFGYDYVPGNLAAGLALERAEGQGKKVAVGYFVGGKGMAVSEGTRASLLGAMLDPGMVFQGGHLQESFAGKQIREFTVQGKARLGLHIAASEGFALPKSYPELTDVEVYLGWFASAAKVMKYVSYVHEVALKVPGYKPLLRNLSGRVSSKGTGPSTTQLQSTTSNIVAEVMGSDNKRLSRVELSGVSPYPYTAAVLAWAAIQLASGQSKAVGAVGPVQAFGLPALMEGNQQAGLSVV